MKKIKLKKDIIPNSKTTPPTSDDAIPDKEKVAISASDYMQNRRGRSERYMSSMRRVTFRKGGGMPRTPKPKRI